jgi:hypothetical protein
MLPFSNPLLPFKLERSNEIAKSGIRETVFAPLLTVNRTSNFLSPNLIQGLLALAV